MHSASPRRAVQSQEIWDVQNAIPQGIILFGSITLEVGGESGRV